jgi:hypothetical protein
MTKATRLLQTCRRRTPRDETERMMTELAELKEQNNKLVEANFLAGATIDSIAKQNLDEHSVKIKDNLKKWQAQNEKSENEKAMEKVDQILENKCKDHMLLQKVTTGLSNAKRSRHTKQLRTPVSLERKYPSCSAPCIVAKMITLARLHNTR